MILKFSKTSRTSFHAVSTTFITFNFFFNFILSITILTILTAILGILKTTITGQSKLSVPRSKNFLNYTLMFEYIGDRPIHLVRDLLLFLLEFLTSLPTNRMLSKARASSFRINITRRLSVSHQIISIVLLHFQIMMRPRQLKRGHANHRNVPEPFPGIRTTRRIVEFTNCYQSGNTKVVREFRWWTFAQTK